VRRFVDPGAVFAGWVGLGIAVVGAISLALVIAVQPLLFLFAPVGGLLIGYYANARSDRRRPWPRVVANALYAGAVTAISLVLLYGAVRLLFVFADDGYPDFNRPGQETCALGPECTYKRYLRAGRGPELEALGVRDAATFQQYALREQLNGSLGLIALTLVGAGVGGLFYGAGGTPAQRRAGEASLS
jgi:hypothetical protein